MANLLRANEYEAIKNAAVTIVIFKDGWRQLTYGPINYKKAIEEIIDREKNDCRCYILPSGFSSQASRVAYGDLVLEWDELVFQERITNALRGGDKA